MYNTNPTSLNRGRTQETQTTLGTIPKSNRKIVEKGKIDNLNTPVHDRSLSWLGAYTSIKSGGVKLVLRADLDNTI